MCHIGTQPNTSSTALHLFPNFCYDLHSILKLGRVVGEVVLWPISVRRLGVRDQSRQERGSKKSDNPDKSRRLPLRLVVWKILPCDWSGKIQGCGQCQDHQLPENPPIPQNVIVTCSHCKAHGNAEVRGTEVWDNPFGPSVSPKASHMLNRVPCTTPILENKTNRRSDRAGQPGGLSGLDCEDLGLDWFIWTGLVESQAKLSLYVAQLCKRLF